MPVRIITDSAAALPADLVAQHGIGVVPLWLHVGGHSYRDDELPLDVLAELFDEPIHTAAPSPGEIIQVAEAMRERDEPIVFLTVGSSISSTYEAVLTAAKALDGDVRVIDTLGAAGAQGLVVLRVAERAAPGAAPDELVAAAKQVIDRVRLMATVPDLDRLAHSGRVPEAARRIGARVGAQPLFELRGGSIRAARPAFSRAAALERIVNRCASDAAGGRLHVAMLHALDDDAARALLHRLEPLEPESCYVGPFSPVMVAHTGVGLAGLAWWVEP